MRGPPVALFSRFDRIQGSKSLGESVSFNLSHAFQIGNTPTVSNDDLEGANKVQRDEPKRHGCKKKSGGTCLAVRGKAQNISEKRGLVTRV